MGGQLTAGAPISPGMEPAGTILADCTVTPGPKL
jgi:hypothetical protein